MKEELGHRDASASRKNRCSNLPNDKVDHLRRDEEEEGVAEVEHRRPEVVNTEAPHLDR